MFKKPPIINPLSNLKNSERKKLLNAVRDQTGDDEYQFPTSVVKHTTFKARTSTGTVYTDEENAPILLKEKYSEALLPTVFTCWMYPNLFPVVHTHEHVVEEKLRNGADLMLPGTIPPFPASCKKGSVVAIASSATPNVAKAVGIVQLDMENITSVIGTVGIAVKVCHTLDDGLCEVFKVKWSPPPKIELQGPLNDKINDLIIEDDAEEYASVDGSLHQDLTGKHKGTREDDVSKSSQLPTEEVDHFLAQAVYYTLAHDKKLELPITASSFVSNHIMKNLPKPVAPFITLKKSSWSKAAKFLKYFESEGFIKLKGKVDNMMIISVNRDKDKVKTCEVYKTADDKPASVQAPSNKAEASIEVVSSFQVKTPYKKDAAEVGIQPTDLSLPHEIRHKLEKYVREKNLVNPQDNSKILLNDVLLHLVYKSSSATTSRSIPRSKLLDSLIGTSFTEFSMIYKNGVPMLPKPCKNRVPKIEVVTETKIHRKIVTRVNNFETYGVDASELASLLRKRCSGSTTIGETKDSSSMEVQVQGPHGETAIQILTEYGIPKKYIEFKNNLKPKKKKN